MHSNYHLFDTESGKVVESLIGLYKKLYLEPKEVVVECLRKEIDQLGIAGSFAYLAG